MINPFTVSSIDKPFKPLTFPSSRDTISNILFFRLLFFFFPACSPSSLEDIVISLPNVIKLGCSDSMSYCPSKDKFAVVGEFLLLLGVAQVSSVLSLFALIGVVLGGVYSF